MKIAPVHLPKLKKPDRKGDKILYYKLAFQAFLQQNKIGL